MFGNILTILVAFEAIYIMYLEVFATPKQQADTFGVDEELLHNPQVRSLLGNQGIYNGVFGLLILSVLFFFHNQTSHQILMLLMMFIIIVAIYGGFTVNKRIILLQGLPALATLIALFFF